MEIRRFKPTDYDVVYKLWEDCNLSLGKSDSREEVLKFINMNPETSLVGIVENEIISCILGGYDGRRGLVHHLSVHPGYQRRGYGIQLMGFLERKFKENGVVKVSFWVLKTNLDVVNFYKKIGYRLRDDLVTLSKIL